MSETKPTAAQAAIARVELPANALQKIEDVRAHLVRLSESANLVSPFSSIDYVPQMQRVSFRIVVIDPTLKEVKRPNKDESSWVGTDCYRDPKFCSTGERALTKTGILKLFRAAGITIVESRREDDRADSHLVAWRVVIDVPELDGGVTRYVGTKEIDFRPGSPQIVGMSEKQGIQAAMNILENAETKALLRAARAALQLRQKYTVEELAKPFVIPVLVPDLDSSDPEIRRMMAAKALGMERAIYGGGKEVTPSRIVTIDAGTVDNFDPATGEVYPPADPAEMNAAATEDLSGFEEAQEAEPQPDGCTCPCGCTAKVSAAAAEVTTKNRGVVRCAKCYPSRQFDEEMHKGLASLAMTPDITVKQAVALKTASLKRASTK